GSAFLAIGRPNISTKMEVRDWLAEGAKVTELNPFKKGVIDGLGKITKYSYRAAALATALGLAAGTFPEVFKTMNDSQKSANTLRVPTDKFLEGVKKNETGLIKFGPAIQAVIDF